MTVKEYTRHYMSFQLLYAFHQTPFGKCLIAVTSPGKTYVAYLTFVDDDDVAALRDLKLKWPCTQTSKDIINKTNAVVAKIFHPAGPQLHSIRVLMKGSEFQIKVWRALTRIPKGAVTTYEGVAWMAGNPRAAIAVGDAVSKNYVGYVVPCHRVGPKNVNRVTKFAWGLERKTAILEYEKQLYVN